MIPTYHCARYLGETLRSVLAQDAGPDAMQIEVVDDHSTQDDPESVVREVGRGRVGFFRQPANVGITRNFATCIARSRGRLVHLLHGDDLVRDGFYASLQRAFDADPAIGAAFCRQIFVNGNGDWIDLSPLEQPRSGRLEGALERLATEQRIMTPSIVVRRDVYEALGGFDDRLRCSEDWEMWVRIACPVSGVVREGAARPLSHACELEHRSPCSDSRGHSLHARSHRPVRGVPAAGACRGYRPHGKATIRVGRDPHRAVVARDP